MTTRRRKITPAERLPMYHAEEVGGDSTAAVIEKPEGDFVIQTRDEEIPFDPEPKTDVHVHINFDLPKLVENIADLVRGQVRVARRIRRSVSNPIQADEQQQRIFTQPSRPREVFKPRDPKVEPPIPMGGLLQTENPALYVLRTGNNPVGKHDTPKSKHKDHDPRYRGGDKDARQRLNKLVKNLGPGGLRMVIREVLDLNPTEEELSRTEELVEEFDDSDTMGEPQQRIRSEFFDLTDSMKRREIAARPKVLKDASVMQLREMLDDLPATGRPEGIRVLHGTSWQAVVDIMGLGHLSGKAPKKTFPFALDQVYVTDDYSMARYFAEQAASGQEQEQNPYAIIQLRIPEDVWEGVERDPEQLEYPAMWGGTGRSYMFDMDLPSDWIDRVTLHFSDGSKRGLRRSQLQEELSKAEEQTFFTILLLPEKKANKVAKHDTPKSKHKDHDPRVGRKEQQKGLATGHRETWLASLPSEVREVFEGDSSDHSNLEVMARLQVNADLLGEEGPLSNYPEYSEMIEQIGRALKLATTKYATSLPQDVRVFRGVDKKRSSADSRNSYLYVTTDPKMAAKYAGKHGVVQEATVSAGSPVAYGWGDQNELILPQGAALDWAKDASVEKKQSPDVLKAPGIEESGPELVPGYRLGSPPTAPPVPRGFKLANDIIQDGYRVEKDISGPGSPTDSSDVYTPAAGGSRKQKRPKVQDTLGVVGEELD